MRSNQTKGTSPNRVNLPDHVSFWLNVLNGLQYENCVVTLPTHPDFPNELLTYYLKVSMNLILTTNHITSTQISGIFFFV